jgi:HAD superfamily hydrolase (TIGR01549 family)
MYKKMEDPLRGRKIRCILFDLGSTLWDKIDNPALRQQLEQKCDQQAIAILQAYRINAQLVADAADAAMLMQQLRAEFQSRVGAYFQDDENHEPDFVALIGEALQQVGVQRVDYQMAQDIYEALRIPIDRSRALFDGVHSTLARLQARGFVLGVVTNRAYGGPVFLESMRKMGLLEYFDQQHIAISADLKVRKPHAEIFRYALNGLKMLPEETAMVGDNLYADVTGAKSLGMVAVWRPKLALLAQAQAYYADSGSTFDQDALVAYVTEWYKQKQQRKRPNPAQPDITIDHIAELLDIFPQVG